VATAVTNENGPRPASATIVYTAINDSAKEVRIAVTNPVFECLIAFVRGPTAGIDKLEMLVTSGRSAAEEGERQGYAEQLACGSP
jgi:hypothetical protein